MTQASGARWLATEDEMRVQMMTSTRGRELAVVAAPDGLLGRCVRLAKGCAPSAMSFATGNSTLLHPAEDGNVRNA